MSETHSEWMGIWVMLDKLLYSLLYMTAHTDEKYCMTDKIMTLRLTEKNQQALLEIQKHLLERTQVGDTRWRNSSSMIRTIVNRYWQAIDLGIADKIDNLIDDTQANSGKGICWLREMDKRRDYSERVLTHPASYIEELPEQEGE